MNNLAVAYTQAGELERALPLYQEVRRSKAKLGPDHPNTLGPTGDLAGNYVKAKRFAEGESLLREAIARQRKRVHACTNAVATDHEMTRLSWFLSLLGDR